MAVSLPGSTPSMLTYTCRSLTDGFPDDLLPPRTCSCTGLAHALCDCLDSMKTDLDKSKYSDYAAAWASGGKVEATAA